MNLLSAVRLAGWALRPQGAVEFQESGNNRSAKVSNHLNSTRSSLELLQPLKVSILFDCDKTVSFKRKHTKNPHLHNSVKLSCHTIAFYWEQL